MCISRLSSSTPSSFLSPLLTTMVNAQSKSMKSMKAPPKPTVMKSMKAAPKPRTAAIDMLGWLKYRASTKAKTSEAEKDIAQKALDTYKPLPDAEKEKFVQKWQDTKDTKSLSWVKDFNESLNKTIDTKKLAYQGHFNRTRQLRCNAFMHMSYSAHDETWSHD